ncbi:hypothetical protein [Blastopirellula marina]|uniref:hypothetical protein n=1 Tax=Blastopirellula marina TaxID=124 RepID=UPI001304BEA7|nr:hypothetical protein [Blastopirellula marina]
MDNLNWYREGIAWQFIKPSKHRRENEDRARAFSEMMLRYQGRTTMANTPLIEAATMTALVAWLSMKKPIPIWKLPDIFDPKSSTYRRVLSDCTEADVCKELARWKELTKAAQRYELGPAHRMFRATLGSEPFRLRCQGNFNLPKFLKDGGMVLIEGGHVSPEAKRAVFGAILQHITHLAIHRKFKTPVIVVCDEAHEYAGSQEANALRELLKFNVLLHMISQSLFGDSEIQEAMLQNSERIEIYRCDSTASAHRFAGMILPGLPWETKLQDVQYQIMRLRRRERFVREGNRSWREYAPYVEDPYPWPSLTEKRTWQAIRKSIGEHGDRFCVIGSEKTQAPQDKPSEPSPESTPNLPSPAMKLRAALSRNSNASEES